MSLYESLEINRNASDDEIKKAFRKLSLIHHPDKGGDPEKFKVINHAYEVLSDSDRRRVYDQTGSDQENAAPNMDGMGGMPFGMGGFGMPFGMGGMHFNMNGFGSQQRQKAPRGPDTTIDVNLSLSDFYKGCEAKININQQRNCSTCNGVGALKVELCNGCNGQGMKITIQQIAPGMIQQSMGTCPNCSGTGKRTLQSCNDCNGQKYKKVDKLLKALIKPGYPNNHKIRFSEEGSDSPDYEKPGDVVLNLIRNGSNQFEWKGNNLHINHSVSMADALLGFNIIVKNHPNGKDISLNWDGGSLQNDGILIGKGLGMPILNTSKYGDLIIHIKISNQIINWSLEQRNALKTVFPQWNENNTSGINLSF